MTAKGMSDCLDWKAGSWVAGDCLGGVKVVESCRLHSRFG